MSLSQFSMVLSAEAAAGLAVVLPSLASVMVDEAGVHAGRLLLAVHVPGAGAPCPACGTWCSRVRDSYVRRLAGAPADGQPVVVLLRVRRLACENAGCERKTFTEQPAGLAVRYARKTVRLAAQLTAVAVELAGRAGSRLARAVLAVPVSRHALIRILARLPDPPAGLVRVLGVDDFAIRRGCSYATILVDMETGDPVDVLPDREQATLEQWLRQHPGTEVICRDRAGSYAAAAAAAAPDAVQVADRWHILHNLGEHARDDVARHRDCLAQDACTRCPQPAGPGEQDPEQEPEPGLSAQAEAEAVIQARHAQVQQLRAAGQDLAQAAAALGLTAQAAGRYWRAASPQVLLAVRGASALDPHKPYLHRRWAQGATVIRKLYREISELGYAGSYSTVYDWCRLLKLAAPPRPPAPPSARHVTGLITRNPARLSQDEQAQLHAILARCPELETLAWHVSCFAQILLSGDTGPLDDWLQAAGTAGLPGLRSFARGIRLDYQAVRNAIALPWSSGKVEGTNTRTKFLKRQMYGRATFPVLRKRILTSSTRTAT